MKKIITFISVLIILFTFGCKDVQAVNQIVGGTLTGGRIGVPSGTITGFTANVSNISGGPYFVSNPSVNLTPYVGLYVTLTETTHNIKALISSVGTGETLSGTELFLNGTMTDWTGTDPNAYPTSWILTNNNATNYVTNASGTANFISDNTYAVGINQTVTTVFGALNKQTFVVVVNSGGWRENSDATGGAYVNYTSGATVSRYYTALGTTFTQYFFRWNVGPCNYTIDNVSLQRVITPSSTGVVTGAWTGDTETFNYDAASFTLTISQN